jgi:hypothetical protein
MVFTWKPVYLVYDELLYKELALDILHLKPLQSYMYPPLYSLMISPGFMMGDYFYEGILACNILGKAVGLYIIYCLLIRISDEHTSALALCMIGFSPIYFIYSRYILAENLFAPILIITILYYIIYRDEVLACGGVKRRVCLTCGAIALATGLFWTKYLAIVLFPVFCIYWSGIFKRLPKGMKKGLLRAIIFTFCVISLFISYGYLCAKIHNEIFDITYLKQTMGFGFGSGPELTGYRMLPEFKWIICYTLYSFLCAVFPVTICFANYNKESIKKVIYKIGFIIIVMIMFIFVAARHSSVVHYNADGVMLKLLGRYVSYSCVLALIIWVLLNGEKGYISKKAYKIVGIFCINVLLIVSYFVLYRGVIWKTEKGWLDGVRGVEQTVLIDYGMPFLILSGIMICLIIGIYPRSRVVTVGTVVALFLFCDYHALSNSYGHNKELADYTMETKMFLDVHGDDDSVLLCESAENYNYANQRKDFYRINNDDFSLTIIPIVYEVNGRLTEFSEENTYIELRADEIDSEVYSALGADLSKTIFFIKWEKNIFSSADFDYEIVKGKDSQIGLRYRDEGKSILMYGNYIINPLVHDGEYSIAYVPFAENDNLEVKIFNLYNLTCSEHIKLRGEG